MAGRILIVYDTKGGTTGEIIQWIKEGASMQGAKVDVKGPSAVTSLNYDLIVVGTPIYNDRPMRSIKHFLEREGLRGRKVALFVVCFAGIFGMRNFMVRKYLDQLRDACDGIVVKMTSFDSAMGPWRKINRAICIDFGKELASQPYSPPTAVETA